MKTSRAVWEKQVRKPGSLFSDLSKDPQSDSEGSAPRSCRTWMGKSFDYKCSPEYWPLLITYLLPARFSSVQFSHSVMSDSLRPHGLQHARLLCPSPPPRAYSNSCPLHWWCHPTISSSAVPFSSHHLQSFPAPGSFPMSGFFPSDGQSIGVSASAPVLPLNIQDWFPLGLTSWISLQSKRLSRVFSNTTVQKHQFFGAQLSLESNSHIRTWLLEKP